MRMKQMIHLVSAHAEGRRGDVVVGGLPAIPGHTVRDKALYFQDNLDHLRKLLVLEPRSFGTSVSFVVASNRADADFGCIVASPTGYVSLSGSDTMCVATVLLETGMIPMTEPVTEFNLETPAGAIAIRAQCRDGKVLRTSFLYEPAVVCHDRVPVDVPGLGAITVDVAWCGVAYVIVDADALGFDITRDEAVELVEVGERIRAAAHEQLPVAHPLEPRAAGIARTLFAGPLRHVDGELRARNTVVARPSGVDRSPCGSGTSARLALLHARGEVESGQTLVHESILGTTFTASVENTVSVGDLPAVRVRVGGQSWITAIKQIVTDPTDPFPQGFALGDIWKAIDTVDRVQ